MSKRKHVWRWFWAWSDEKEERWLEQMAQQGWHLVGGPIRYTFEQGAPAQVRYRLDYRSSYKDIDEYLRLCSDAGWERVMQFAGWQYFRTTRADAPELYTDAASRIAKYQRLMGVCFLLSACAVASNINTLINPTGHRSVAEARWGVIILFLVWAFVLIRLGLHIHMLKKRSGVNSVSQH